MPEPFTFPHAPDPDAIEWPGVPIGPANVITRTRGRTALHDKALDRQPGRRDALVEAALAHMRRTAGRELVYVHDVVIHGVRVRATTNSDHLHDYWVDNWFSPEEWRAMTGMEAPAEPQVTVYAFGRVADQPEAAYYSRATSTIAFFNTAYYGQLKSWVLGAVGRVLAEEYGIHSIHGACLEKDGHGVLYIAPTGTGKSTSSYGLMSYPRTRFHSDDWVYVRYTYRTKDGRRVHPLRVTTTEGEVRGYRVFKWLEERGAGSRGGLVHGLDLADRRVEVPLGDLDLDGPLEAYAFTSEKVYYLRTNLVENFPTSAHQMLRSKMENVPEVTPAYLRQVAPLLDELVAEIRDTQGREAAVLAAMPEEGLRDHLARMIAFDNARAMLDISRVLPADRVFTNPMEPTRLASIILLKRDRRDPIILERLSEPRFIARLLIGETPERKREVAYNAYRAVDDEEETAYIRRLEQATAARAGDDHPVEALYETFAARTDVPETLEEEFSLFRAMYRACRCYELNTILAADPQVADKKGAVETTMRLIARVIDERPDRLRHTLDTYREFIGAGAQASR